MLQRIDELDMDLAAAGYRIFLHQIADARYQRGKQRMGLGREIAADEQRLLELAEILPSRLGNGIDVALGHIGAQHADGGEPEVGRQKVGDDQANRQLPPAMVAAGGIACPADLFQAVDVEAEKHPHDAEIIVEVAQIDHPAGNRVEPGARPQELQEFRAAVAEKGDKRLGAEQVEERTDQGGDDQADDLIL
ncbi:MAG: hypothetical protein ACD_75C01354G0001, partial [uncultured bacterium]